MRFWGNFLVYATFLALSAFAIIGLISCAPMTPPVQPEPQVITIDVPRVVQRACPDTRPARDYKDLPDDPEDLEAVPEGDYEKLFRIAKEALRMARAWLSLDEVQIKGCAASP